MTGTKSEIVDKVPVTQKHNIFTYNSARQAPYQENLQCLPQVQIDEHFQLFVVQLRPTNKLQVERLSTAIRYQ